MPLKKLFGTAAVFSLGATSVFAAPPVTFNQDVRPILSENCFACHGPDRNTRAANLRLDQPNRTIIPGDVVNSEVARRILKAANEPGMMPPADSHKKLTAAQKSVLLRWIDDGARYQKHWAYEPPVRPQIPAGQNPIDFLVQKRLAERGLKPSPTADRRTLIRRLSFDLTGLPPKPEEVVAFVNDSAPDAYAKLVTRLLSSPHYGERMAQGWLDAVRFADTIGYHSDNPRNIWPYRDYVINSFNANKSFAQFTREQLAGDLLPGVTQETKVGSAFNRLLLTTEEGGAQPKDYESRYLTDRVRAVGTVWLGQTTGCAQCHDHKFDPISQKDFYRLGAFFADIEEGIIGGREPGMPVLSNDQIGERVRLDTHLMVLQKAFDEQWTSLTPTQATANEGAMLNTQADGSVLASGPSPDKAIYTIGLRPTGAITGLRLDVLPDASLPSQGPGRANNGNFVLSQLTAQIVKPGAEPRTVVLSNAIASFEQTSGAEANPDKRWSAASVLNPDNVGWAILPEAGKPQYLILTLAEKLTLASDETLQVALIHNYGSQHAIGHFRLSTTQANTALAADLTQTKKEKAAFEASVPKCLISIKSANPRTVRVLPRGNWMDETGEVVTAATPAFLPPIAGVNGKAPGRLELANWLMSKENPLTARAVMNRFWKQFFGNGISKVLEDLGAQGEPPTNPALLDWLACEFRDSGWDVKHMVRLMVNSNTYKQVSTASKALMAADPENREYARQSRFRLDAELVRDNALTISGLLVPKIGGPSVKPYQPERYWENLNFPVRDWVADKNENQWRRGLYTWWQRSFLHPSLLAFDAPSREECAADRPRSNIPQQALVLLNDPTYVEAARAFAGRAMAQPSEARLNWAFQQALQRVPTTTERATLQKLFTDQLAAYKADTAAAEGLVKTGIAPIPANVDTVEFAAWTHVCRVLLNLHETITRP